MGDIAEGLINGDFDEVTGEYLGEGDGYPRSHTRKSVDYVNKRLNEMPSCLGMIQKLLVENGYTITIINKIDYGVQMRLASGGIVNVYTSGKVYVQGKPDEKLNNLIK